MLVLFLCFYEQLSCKHRLDCKKKLSKRISKNSHTFSLFSFIGFYSISFFLGFCFDIIHFNSYYIKFFVSFIELSFLRNVAIHTFQCYLNLEKLKENIENYYKKGKTLFVKKRQLLEF